MRFEEREVLPVFLNYSYAATGSSFTTGGDTTNSTREHRQTLRQPRGAVVRHAPDDKAVSPAVTGKEKGLRNPGR